MPTDRQARWMTAGYLDAARKYRLGIIRSRPWDDV